MRTPAANLLHLFTSVLQKRFAKNGFPHKIRPAPSVASGDPALQDGLHLFLLFPEDPAHDEPDDTATPPHAGRKRCRTECAGAGWLVPQGDLTPEGLAKMLLNSERLALVEIAEKAKNMQKINATREVVAACEELA